MHVLLLETYISSWIIYFLVDAKDGDRSRLPSLVLSREKIVGRIIEAWLGEEIMSPFPFA